jgi:hypothetical protein
MVRVINAHLRTGEQGQYVSLELQGDITLVQSQNTGRFYATAKRCFIFSTFDEEIAKKLIGTEMPGTIERVECEAYDYTVPETGEVIKMGYTYAYCPPNSKPIMTERGVAKERQPLLESTPE